MYRDDLSSSSTQHAISLRNGVWYCLDIWIHLPEDKKSIREGSKLWGANKNTWCRMLFSRSSKCTCLGSYVIFQTSPEWDVPWLRMHPISLFDLYLNSGCFYWDCKNASEWCSAWEGSWFHVYPDKSIGVSAEHASAGTRVLSASTRVPEQLRWWLIQSLMVNHVAQCCTKYFLRQTP